MNGIRIDKIDIPAVKSLKGVESIGNDFAVLTNVNSVPLFEHPTKMNCIFFALCINGTMEIGINLEQYTLRKNQIVAIQADQIVQLFKVSDDFVGHFVIFTRKFLQEARVDIAKAFPMMFFLKDNPCVTLSDEDMENFSDYVLLLQKKIKNDNQEFRKNVIQHLLNAIFYEMNMVFSAEIHKNDKPKTRQEEIFEKFMDEVNANFMKERTVSFYADRLCMTPKYLSSAIKEATGRLAGEWIDQSVILEAKKLLKSSDLTIQQISQELNFANQSFFGKYFKHHTGLSPSEYKKV